MLKKRKINKNRSITYSQKRENKSHPHVILYLPLPVLYIIIWEIYWENNGRIWENNGEQMRETLRDHVSDLSLNFVIPYKALSFLLCHLNGTMSTNSDLLNVKNGSG